MTNIPTYISNPIFQFPFINVAPAYVDDIIDGNLASVAITINLLGFIGSNPAKYVNKSFGVPGSKNRINIIYSICFGCVNNLLFSIF